MASIRILSGIQATGTPHLGNYLGAIRSWVQHASSSTYFMIADLHAITVPKEPELLAQGRFATAAGLLSAGLEATSAVVFAQSVVPEHTQLAWLLGSITSMGELQRMTQFKAKSDSLQETASAGLFTYPILQAADILLYDADQVPVGDDQRQHIELARDLAIRFNHRFGDTFKVPVATFPPVGARVMDLQEPRAKMSKSAKSRRGVVLLTDDDTAIQRKFRRAVTDSHEEVGYDASGRPGIANMIEIAAAVRTEPVEQAIERYSGWKYGKFKDEVADLVINLVAPIRGRIAEFQESPQELRARLGADAERATHIASQVLRRAKQNIGLGEF